MQTPTTYYAHGKLLISGEYAVLDGAKALAVPTKLGQSMTVTPDQTGNLNWIAFDYVRNDWMEAQFALPDLQLVSELTPHSNRLTAILHAVKELSPSFLQDSEGLDVVTNLEFPSNWGLGSSSTLIYNIAQWAGVDAFELLQLTFGGSGYDLACAGADGPIVYQIANGRPEWQPVAFNPPFQDHLYFIHLGHKQDSREGIARYKASGAEEKLTLFNDINDITESMLVAKSMQDFQQLMDAHETIISEALDLPKVKDQYFSELDASVKSLGAWGGDMVMVASPLNKEQLRRAVHRMGFEIVLSWQEMVL